MPKLSDDDRDLIQRLKDRRDILAAQRDELSRKIMETTEFIDRVMGNPEMPTPEPAKRKRRTKAEMLEAANVTETQTTEGV